MLISITSEQAASLAPDAPSLKAARSLATPRPWSTLGRDDRSIWGACQGSAKDPYLTQVDWQGPAFKCTCPSRKFPCKHGLALLLLLAEQAARFEHSVAPEWVASWIQSRSQRAETKAAKESAEPDPEARAKRAEQRAERISAGLDDLELWLRDLIGQGLATAPGRGFEFWDGAAARLVDAQAPGVARRVRDLAGHAASGEQWQTRLVEAVAQITLLIHAWRRIDALPESTQADVRAAIGLNVAQEDVLAGDSVRDLWLVAGQRVTQEERIRVQRSWLTGTVTGRVALVLEFAVGTSGFKNNLLPGAVIDADLCYFPGADPLRALVKAVHGSAIPPRSFPGAQSISEALRACGSRLAANPWTETQPVNLAGVVAIPSSTVWSVVDPSGAAMPLRPDFSLLAVSRGRPSGVFGEWNGYQLFPLMAAVDGRLVPLQQGAPA